MWLVQLYKGNDSVPTGSVFHTADCSIEYIDPTTNIYEEAQQNLCESWDEPIKKRMLIIKKSPDEITIRPLHNERFMGYYCRNRIESLDINTNSYIISLEYLDNESYVLEFYVDALIFIRFDVPDEILNTSDRYNRMRSFLDYIRGKTFKISVRGNSTPKYSITFDDSCKYYYMHYEDGYIPILVVKNPFLLGILLHPSEEYFLISILIKTKIIEDLNHYESNESSYNPEDDRPLIIDEIVNTYFDVNDKTGISHENVNVNDTTNNFGYNLIRALLGTFRSEIADRYEFSLDNDVGEASPPVYIYTPINQIPICTYFPLFRAQLDYNGLSNRLPQYDPNDASKYVYNFVFWIYINSFGEVINCMLVMDYGNRMTGITDCAVYALGHMPAWRSTDCDLTLPFRFAGSTSCDGIDYWAHNTIEHNANYLFRIVKSVPPDPESDTYNIEGVGCNELITPISSFINFIPNGNYIGAISAFPIVEIQRINFSESGYPIGAISSTLATFREEMANNETCFVLFNESLIEDVNDFISIYEAVTAALPRCIVCYMGSSAKVPGTHKNKIIHSDAIVTDLDTNEQIPLVIKYIKYVKRVYNLFKR